MQGAAQGARDPAKAQAVSFLGSSLGRALGGAMGGGSEREELEAKQAAKNKSMQQWQQASQGDSAGMFAMAKELAPVYPAASDKLNALGLATQQTEKDNAASKALREAKNAQETADKVAAQKILNDKGKVLASKLGETHPFYDQLMSDNVSQGLLTITNKQLGDVYNTGVKEETEAAKVLSEQATLNTAGSVLAATLPKSSPYYEGLNSKTVTPDMLVGATAERDATYKRKIVAGEVTAEQQEEQALLKKDAKSLALTLGSTRYPDTYATLMYNPTQESYTKALAKLDSDKKVSKTQVVPTAASTARQAYEYVQKNPEVKGIANVQTLATRALTLMNSNDPKTTTQLFKTVSDMYNNGRMATAEIDRLTESGTIPEKVTNALRSSTIGTLDRDVILQLRGVVEAAQTAANETLGTIVVREFNSRLPSFADDPTILEQQLLTFFPASSIVQRIDPAARAEHPEGTIMDGKLGGPQEGKRFMVIAGHIVEI
jgi:hypothetical protein